jgi:hypothetical protein
MARDVAASQHRLEVIGLIGLGLGAAGWALLLLRPQPVPTVNCAVACAACLPDSDAATDLAGVL